MPVAVIPLSLSTTPSIVTPPAAVISLIVSTFKLPVAVVSPVTPSVPAIVVLPVAAVTLNLLVFTSKLPSTPNAPVTSIPPARVIFPPTVALPDKKILRGRVAPVAPIS